MDTDWTFSTDYAGTLARYERAEGSGGGSGEAPLTLVEASSGSEFDSAVLTVDGIAYDKLKRRDPILFFDDVPLFDDELHDCGLAALSVKVVRGARFVSQFPTTLTCLCLQRVMPERWFVLSQYWMRVDGGLLRAIETRLFHEMGTEEMFRRRTVKEIDSKALQKVGSVVLAFVRHTLIRVCDCPAGAPRRGAQQATEFPATAAGRAGRV